LPAAFSHIISISGSDRPLQSLIKPFRECDPYLLTLSGYTYLYWDTAKNLEGHVNLTKVLAGVDCAWVGSWGWVLVEGIASDRVWRFTQ